MQQRISIKNMVCDRCIKVVREELEQGGYQVMELHLGSALLETGASKIDLEHMGRLLKKQGFELLLDQKAELVEQIKSVIIDLIYHNKLEQLSRNVSNEISDRVGRDYSYLSNLFSTVESVTIEKYMIVQKIERVKELLVYEELNLSEIAAQLGYSSVQHLSSQFKKITGLTPSHFKSIKAKRRKSIDHVGGNDE